MFWTHRSNGKYASSTRALKPMARSEDLVIQEIEDEVLVYDEQRARAHCLSADAARVWRACDGRGDIASLAAQLELDDDVVTRALAELEEKELLDPGPVLNGNGQTRREFGFKVAKLGALGAAVPMIYSVGVATPMAAATPTPQQCLFYSAQSCDGCASICGCCCCCQGCSSATEPACKLCFPTSLCGTDAVVGTGMGPGDNHCDRYVPGGCSSGPNCSNTAKDPPDCSDPCPPLPDCGGHPCNCFNIGNPCTTP